MSPRRAFDHFMVHTKIGGNRKLRRRLNPDERWCYVAGILAIAADSPIRGCLLIGAEPADDHDLADTAGVSVKVARSTFDKLRALEMVVPDEELECERVHDFDEHNPEPKTDKTAAERMRRYRERLRRNTPLVTDRNGRRNEGRNTRNGLGLVTEGREVEGKRSEVTPCSPYVAFPLSLLLLKDLSLSKNFLGSAA
jgi:hypothetical protein